MGKKSSASKMTVTVQIVPVDGRPESKTVQVSASGAKLKDVLKAAGVSAKNKDLFVGGEPAKLDTFVGDNGKVSVRASGGQRSSTAVSSGASSPTVTVSERPQGS